MKYLVVDTEGSGLFQYKDANGNTLASDAPGQPRLAHLAMYPVDMTSGETPTLQHFYIKPDGWQMTAEATAINGLTDEFLAANGVPVKQAMEAYARYLDEGYILTAYNAQHDGRQLRAELRRAGMEDRFETTKQCCLMRSSTGMDIKKANGKGGWPSLSDVCAHFGIVHDGPHKAENDAKAAVSVFLKLHELGKLQEPAVHRAKNPPQKVVPRTVRHRAEFDDDVFEHGHDDGKPSMDF